MSTTNTDALLAIGDQCSAQYCRLVDFLPFKCQHCDKKFCGEHYLPSVHECDKYDESKHNRVAPSCPLCNTPVSIPVGQDPNIRMEYHITSECSVMTGKTKSSSQPHCASSRCKKVLYAPIRCTNCKKEFCPQHRFPADHACIMPQATASPPSQNKLASAASEISAAAKAAIKQSVAAKPVTSTASKPTMSSAKAIRIQPASSSASTSNASKHNPFSKTDRSANLSSCAIDHISDYTTDSSFVPPPLFATA